MTFKHELVQLKELNTKSSDTGRFYETPEGQSIGIVLNLSLLTRISERFPSVLIKEVIETSENIILLDEYDGPNDQTKIFLNGSKALTISAKSIIQPVC